MIQNAEMQDSEVLELNKDENVWMWIDTIPSEYYHFPQKDTFDYWANGACSWEYYGNYKCYNTCCPNRKAVPYTTCLTN